MSKLASAEFEVDSRIAGLLSAAGLDAEVLSVSTCSQGANNRIYRVATPAGAFAVKEYFRHAHDPRDRLGAETAFSRYANRVAPGRTPRLLTADAAAGMALFEFVEGTPISARTLLADDVDAAIAFFRSLNDEANRAGAQLPTAAEATFTVAEQLAIIDGRLSQLAEFEAVSATDRAALDLIVRLRLLWSDLAGAIRRQAEDRGLDRKGTLKCVSPSDFGFHNALRTATGVRFLDFEYAGWDDPAKTAGDFFAQIAVPVPFEFCDHFVASCFEVLPDPAAAAERARLLRPAYQVKWCCIALNVFLPVHLTRRRFAKPDLDVDALKRAQLDKAAALMSQIAGHTTTRV